jgi:EAL domain-containing protein (putative c-di-GMP-specific phosphodiesterase class I)
MADGVAKAALERALDERETLVLLYQPIHEARTRRIYAAEALLRQRRQSGELREASIIHEAAEDSCGPELFELDHFLVRRSYVDAAGWQKHFDVRLNVNLSPREFQEGDVLDRLAGLLESCGTDPARVNVEITETSYIRDPERTVGVLNAIRETGVHLWLDDFGTGHSALTHLQFFPVEGIKLPGGFVSGLPDDKRSRALCAHLIALAHDLGMRVIAEEVERQDQLDVLLEQGCDYVQGFLYSRPMRVEELETLLRSSTDPAAPRGPGSRSS